MILYFYMHNGELRLPKFLEDYYKIRTFSVNVTLMLRNDVKFVFYFYVSLSMAFIRCLLGIY